MPFLPLSQNFSAKFFKNVRFIATDMDGTLTDRDKFTPALLQTLADLAAVDIQVFIITGRSAGWVSGLVSYLPVVGAIAENGGLFYLANDAEPKTIVPIPHIASHRQALAQTFYKLQTDFPQLRETADNCFRLTDWTFDVRGLTLADLQILRDRCEADGWSFTYSTVQCHIKPIGQDKATALDWVLQHHFPQYERSQVLTVGDSPNDESLFDGDRFPLSVGVANIRHYTNQLVYQPTYMTQLEEARGFCELARFILQSHVRV
ncbi:HAD family phosphatase [Oculatella sp. LEGE 06141]|uniref:HAD-IIB family hydrolase n=1 Tax=Oculatella sp. LEGE 06141 TaxID=1828648 RepID=UPI001881D772|nr:HAD family hydrolase [Oculatella sp. LEGE 06141]MBE9177689.1 HAD family phosphatase [Oculatella sp. LEGE 06141]